MSLKSKIKYKAPESPGSPVVRTLCFFHGGGPGSIPGQGTEILQAMWCGQKKKREKENASNAVCSRNARKCKNKWAKQQEK